MLKWLQSDTKQKQKQKIRRQKNPKEDERGRTKQRGIKATIIDAIIDTRSAPLKGGGHFLWGKNATVLIYG